MTKVQVITLITLCAANIAAAHPGHDHSAPDSSLMHALFYSCLFALIGVAAYLGAKILQKHLSHSKAASNKVLKD